MPRRSKSKLQVYSGASAQLIPEIAPIEAKLCESSRAYAKKNREDAEKPLYLARV